MKRVVGFPVTSDQGTFVMDEYAFALDRVAGAPAITKQEVRAMGRHSRPAGGSACVLQPVIGHGSHLHSELAPC